MAAVTDRDELRLRLRDSLTRLDESAVFTIHGFCQRMLQENAFESGVLFESELVAEEQALRETQAQAAWVGWGFVAEHAEFAELCRRLDVVFIGPDPEVMRRLGDKIEAKRLAEQAGVPIAPWSEGPVTTPAEIRDPM